VNCRETLDIHASHTERTRIYTDDVDDDDDDDDDDVYDVYCARLYHLQKGQRKGCDSKIGATAELQ